MSTAKKKESLKKATTKKTTTKKMTDKKVNQKAASINTTTQKKASTQKTSKKVTAKKSSAKPTAHSVGLSLIKPDKTEASVTAPKKNSSVSPTKKKGGSTKITRRRIRHIWPPEGTGIIGRLAGHTFRATFISAPGATEFDLLIKSLDDKSLTPAKTLNHAAQNFTQKVREKNSLGAIANAWKWWRRESDNKRLFDIPEYSIIENGKEG